MNRREFLMSSACACLATATTRVDALLAAETPAPVPILYRCGTPPPTPSEKIQASRVITALRTHRVNFRGKTVVPIRFHILHNGTQGYLPDRQLKAQVALLNRTYAPALIEFTIADVDLHENDAWFTHEPGTDAEIEMKTELGKDPRLPQRLHRRARRRIVGLCHLPLVVCGFASARRRRPPPRELPRALAALGPAALALRSRHDGCA